METITEDRLHKLNLFLYVINSAYTWQDLDANPRRLGHEASVLNTTKYYTPCSGNYQYRKRMK